MLNLKNLLLAGILILILGLVSGCRSCGSGGGGGGRTTDPLAPGTIRASITYSGVFPGDASRTVRWTLVLVQATRTDGRGRTADLILDREYTVSVGTDNTATATEFFSNLKAGIWRVSCQTATWGAQCERTVPADGTSGARFREGEVGCQ